MRRNCVGMKPDVSQSRLYNRKSELPYHGYSTPDNWTWKSSSHLAWSRFGYESDNKLRPESLFSQPSDISDHKRRED